MQIIETQYECQECLFKFTAPVWGNCVDHLAKEHSQKEGHVVEKTERNIHSNNQDTIYFRPDEVQHGTQNIFQ